ncbi:MAG: universal stress protein [Phycisphaerales bacterium]|nr:universal stress protein [Phycisphaerales bacterium]
MLMLLTNLGSIGMKWLENVVAGVDFSECSGAALSQAVRLATAHGGAAHPVCILDTGFVIEIEKTLSTVRAGIREPLIADAKRAWEAFRAKVQGAAALPIHVEVNERVEGTMRYADKVGAGLLVLGAFGEKKPDVGIGTMASGCVRHAGCDVLLVRDTQRGPFKSVLACVDFSENSRRALEKAAAIAANDKAALHVLHVYHGVTNVFPFFSSVVESWIQAVGDDEARAKEALEEFVAKVPAASGLKPALHVTGSATHGGALINFAKSSGAELLVLGTRGATNLRERMLGSTAERVLKGASCSILAVKP